MNANMLNALGEPTRLRIVELLREQPAPVGEIATRLDVRQPQISKHLRVLAEAGIVDMRPAAQQRVYHLQPKPFMELEDWLNSFHPTWAARLDKLDDVLQEMKAEQKHSNAKEDKE